MAQGFDCKSAKTPYLLFFLLVGLFLGVTPITWAHESSPVIVKLSANQEREIRMTVAIELERYLLNNEAGTAAPHSKEADRLLESLKALSTETLSERFRSAFRSGSTVVRLAGKNNRDIPITLASMSVSGSVNDPARKAHSKELDSNSGRKYSLQLTAKLLSGEDGVKISSVQDDASLIVSVVENLFADEAVETQHLYVAAGEYSGQLVMLGDTKIHALSIFVEYLSAGFSHILPKGLDHVLFMIALVLSAPGWKILIWQVSLFTLAHSATLALGILDIVNIPASIVEPLIAVSIIFICFENLRRTVQSRTRPILIVLFGLLHGLGFASVLSEVGLQTGSFALALFAFNFGIEVAQLTVVVIFSLLLAGICRFQSNGPIRVTTPASLALGATGVYLLIERMML